MTRVQRNPDGSLLAEVGEGRDVVLISGPAGAGKTWLADTLLAALRDAGANCGRGKFDDAPGGSPHAPIMAALSGVLTAALDRQFDPQHGLASLTGALGVQLDVLIAIGLAAPGLSTVSALRPLADHRQWRGRIAAAVTALLAWLEGSGAQTVLLIDDWDRASAQGVEIIAAIAAAPVRRPPVLILTGRTEGAIALLPPARIVHRRLAPRPRAAAVALLADLLTDSAAATTIAGQLGDALPRLPFDIAELADVAREAGWLVVADNGGQAVVDPAANLAFTPADRIAALAPAARRAAHALMLWSGPAPASALASALGPDADGLAALVASGIAIAPDDMLTFRHDRLREAARNDLGDPTDLSAAMAERLAIGVAEPIALRLRLGGGLADADAAAWRDRFAAGATAARGGGDNAAAGRFAEAALTLRSRHPPDDRGADRIILREAMLAAAGRDDPVTEARADALVASARDDAEAFGDRELAIVALRFAGMSDAALRIARDGFAVVGIHFPKRTGLRHLIPAMLRWRWLVRHERAAPRIDPALLGPFTGLATAAATTAYQLDPLLTALIGFRAAPLVGRTAREAAYWRGVDAFLFGAAGRPAESAAAGEAALAAFADQVGYRGQSLYQAIFFGTAWRDRLAMLRPRFREVVTLALEEGDPVMAAYGLRTWTMSGWRSAPDLKVLLGEARDALRSLVALGEQSLSDEIASLVATLEGMTGERPWSAELWRTDLPTRSHVFDLELACLVGDWTGTLQLAKRFAPLTRDYAIQSESVLLMFYPMLARLRLGRDVRGADLRRLRRAATLNPADHRGRLLLVEAERLRLRARDCRAAYAEAVAAAETSDSRLLAGLAAEAAADAMRGLGDHAAAADYDARAAGRWRAWGLHPHVRGRDAARVAEAEARLVAAERADRAKSRLMAHVGHELRTPLQALQAQLDLAVAEGRSLAPGSVRDVLASLKAVVDDLDLAAEPGLRDDSAEARVDLEALIASELQLWGDPARNRLAVIGNPPALSLPAARLRQIVRNLVSNATKYGGDGAVLVTLSCGEGEPCMVTITVEDSGPGLPADCADRLFQPFERGLHAGDGRGHGLGLALSRRIAERLGGGLVAANRPAGGACFTLTFPAARAAAPAPPAAARALDLLLVEDTALIRAAVAALLRRSGHRVVEAGDAAGALAALDGIRPDAILLDVGLPDANGLSILDHVRKYHGPLPVILLTAAVDAGLTGRVTADPALRLLRKPASAQALATTLAELCGAVAASPPAGAPPEYARLRTMARREVRSRSARLVGSAAADPAAAHQLAGLAAQFGWTAVADAAERVGSDPSAADRLRAAVRGME